MQRFAAVSLTVLGLLAFGQSVEAADGGVPSVGISSEETAVLAAVFKRAVADPKTIPDGQLLRLRPHVWVREEFPEPGSGKIPQDLMAPLNGWSLGSLQTLQEQADAMDLTVYFVVVNNLTINGTTATIEWGTDFALPTRFRQTVRVCCSLATDKYRKVNGVWVFRKRVDEIVF